MLKTTIKIIKNDPKYCGNHQNMPTFVAEK
jgi:hypothetical protein